MNQNQIYIAIAALGFFILCILVGLAILIFGKAQTVNPRDILAFFFWIMLILSPLLGGVMAFKTRDFKPIVISLILLIFGLLFGDAITGRKEANRGGLTMPSFSMPIVQAPPMQSYQTPQQQPAITRKAEPISEPKEVIPPASVKQIGDDEWRVVINSDKKWFDTRIPIIANYCVFIDNESEDAKYLMKIGNKVFLLGEEGHRDQFYAEESDCSRGSSHRLTVDYDFKDTIKLKLDDESHLKSMQIIFKLSTYSCGELHNTDDTHLSLHQSSEKWLEEMKEKIGRN